MAVQLFGHRLSGQGNGPGLPVGLLDVALRLQLFHVEVNGGRGFQIDGKADLPHRGGITVLPGVLQDEVIDFRLFWCQGCGHRRDLPYFCR